MQVRNVVLFILSLGLLSGCTSIPSASDSKPPPQPPVEQEKAPPRQQSDAVSESTSETNTEPEDGATLHENSSPEVSVEEVIPEDNIPQKLPPIAEIKPPADVEIQPEVPQASLPDRKGLISDQVSDQVRFLLLSPQLDVHFAEGVAETEDAPTEQADAPKSDARASSASTESVPPAESAPPEAPDTTAAQGSSDAQVPEKPEKVSEPPPADQDAEQKKELIRAEPGEHVHLTLPGLGWIYDRGASKAQGVEFQSRNYKDNSTEFVFVAQSIGNYTLSFQQQDSRLGSSSFRTVAVDVGPHPASDQKGGSTTAAESVGIEGGGNMEAEEEGFSFARLEDSISSQNPSDTAEQLKALGRSQSVSDLFTSGKARQEELALLVEAGELLFEAQREPTAEQALRLYLDLTEERGEHTGRVLYLLGQIYESPLPPRNERQSAEYYRKIVSFYPTDPYRRRAEQRIKYLQRHFLQIR